MNHYVVIGIIGILSGALCALADVPLTGPGKGVEAEPDKPDQLAPSWWTAVPEKHFDPAFWLSFLGLPGTYLTLWMLAELIGNSSPGLGLALKIVTFLGAYTGLLFQTAACVKPLVYRNLHGKLSDADARQVMTALAKYPEIPSLVSGLAMFLGSTILVDTAILRGALDVPSYFMLYNPVFAALVLLLVRKSGRRVPIGPLGVGFALFGVVLTVAGLRV